MPVKIQFRIWLVSRNRLPDKHSGLFESGHYGVRYRCGFLDFLGRQRGSGAVFEELDHAAARACHFIGSAIRQLECPHAGGRRAQSLHPSREAEHRVKGRHGVMGRLGQEPAHFPAHRRGVEHARHCPRFGCSDGSFAFAPDDARRRRGAKRNLHERAFINAAARREIIEQSVDRPGREDADPFALLEKSRAFLRAFGQ